MCRVEALCAGKETIHLPVSPGVALPQIGIGLSRCKTAFDVKMLQAFSLAAKLGAATAISRIERIVLFYNAPLARSFAINGM